MSTDRLADLLTYDDVGNATRVSVLVQGPPKTGKTRFWTSWPDPFVVYCDPNLGALRKYVQPNGPLDPKKIVVCPSWDMFESKIMPLVRARKIPGKTLVIDSLSMLANSKADSMPEDERNWGRKWRPLKPILPRTVLRLTDLVRPSPSEPSYNVICTVHEADVTDDAGNRLRIVPAIPGGTKDEIARMFDVVLITQARVEYVGQGASRKKVTKYLLHSTPPDAWHDCGDGLGEEGTACARLPAVLDVTSSNVYSLLCEHWGLSLDAE